MRVLVGLVFSYLFAHPVAAQDEWGLLLPSVSLVSEYRYDGVSYTDSRPTLQGILHWWRPDNYYAGIFASGVDFNDPGDTRIEIDIYGGRHFDFDKTRLTLSGLYTIFPDNSTPGPTYDFFQGKFAVRRSFDALAVTGSAAWTPEASYGSGTAARIAGEFSYEVSPWLSVSGTLGRRWIERGFDRTFWDAGATFSWRRVELDIRYYDTDLSFAECGFVNWCEAGVVGKVSLNAWD
jgi:uncharacterized protein (TIGR02001 family)